jgi:hypothetical protein
VSAADAVGSLGVAILLGAFAANAAGRLASTARAYHALNAVGAGLACWASWQIPFVPFVVLEGIWTLVAIAGLLRRRPGAITSPGP